MSAAKGAATAGEYRRIRRPRAGSPRGVRQSDEKVADMRGFLRQIGQSGRLVHEPAAQNPYRPAGMLGYKAPHDPAEAVAPGAKYVGEK